MQGKNPVGCFFDSIGAFFRSDARMGRTALEFDLDLANALTGLNEPVIKTARFHVKSVFCFL